MRLIAQKPCSFGGNKFFIGEEIPAELVTNPKMQEKMGVTIDEGATIGRQFASGFVSGFNASEIQSAIGGAISGIFKNAGKIFTGDADLSSWLSAALVAKVATPLLGAGIKGVKLGKTIFGSGEGGLGLGSAIIGSAAAGTGLKGLGASAGMFGLKIGSTATTGAGLIASGAAAAGGGIVGGGQALSGESRNRSACGAGE